MTEVKEGKKTGNLVLTLYKNPTKNDDRVYLIPKNVSDINQVGEIMCDLNRPITNFAISVPRDMILLRKKVVDRYYGGIKTLVEKVKSGEVKYSDSRRRFENAN